MTHFAKKVSIGILKYIKDHGHNWTGKTHSEESKRKIGKANSKIQSGSGNSQYGTMWIHNLELKKSKKINKTDQIPDGWIKGRKIKF